MTFRGKESVRTIIIIIKLYNIKVFENGINYEKNYDTDAKLSNFQLIRGEISRIFGSKVI